MRSATVRAIARWTLERRAEKRHPCGCCATRRIVGFQGYKTIRASIKTGRLWLTPMSSEFPNLFDLELREPVTHSFLSLKAVEFVRGTDEFSAPSSIPRAA